MFPTENARLAVILRPDVVRGGPVAYHSGMECSVDESLAGKTVVVTRDDAGNRDLAARIEAVGGRAIAVSTIRVRPLTQTAEFVSVVERLGSFDWIVLTSRNGVRILMEHLAERPLRERLGSSSRIACIGSGTARQLAQYGIEADLVPDVFTSARLGQRLTAVGDIRGMRFLLLRSALASDDMAEILRGAGAVVESAALYDVEPVRADTAALCRQIRRRGVDWLAFACGASVRAFFGVVDRDMVESAGVRIASIGPITSRQLRALGLDVDVEASEHTMEGLVAAIVGSVGG